MENDTVTSHDVAVWLESLPHVTLVTPMSLTIKGKSYPAASYNQKLITPVGSTEQTMVYVVGKLPACRVRGNVVFTIDGDPAEWYVAFYGGEVKNRKQETCTPNKYHPFGNAFGLAPWDLYEPIDQYERFPYKRVPITVRTALSPAIK